MTFGSRLKMLRQEKGLTQAQFGARFNLAESTISLYETEKRTPHYEVLKKFALFFNITTDYLLGHTDKRYPPSAVGEENGTYDLDIVDKPIRIPVVRNLIINHHLIDYDYYSNYQEWISSETIGDGNYFWLPTKDNRLIGEGILEGDLLLIREQSVIDSGEIGVVVIDENDYTVLRVYKNNDSIILQASNPIYPPQIITGKNLRIIGKAIQVRRKLT